MKRQVTRSVIWLCILLPALSGCDSGGGLGSSTRQVDEVEIAAKRISIDETVSMDVFFETETDFAGEPSDVDVVLRVSPALAYVTGSSSIYNKTADRSDNRAPNRVGACQDGHTFLVFRLTKEDLSDHSLNGGAQYGIRLSIKGTQRTNHAQVEAVAGSDQAYSCSEPFPTEESDQVEVM